MACGVQVGVGIGRHDGLPHKQPHTLIQRMKRHKKDSGIKVPLRREHSKQMCIGVETWIPAAMVTPDPALEEDVEVDLGEKVTDARLYDLPEEVGDGQEKIHTLLHMPTKLPKGSLGPAPSSTTLNILMVDVSGSMEPFWKSVVQYWNQYVAPTLMGHTNIYVFSTQVIFRRSGVNLHPQDFLGGGTDFIGALQTVVSDVYQCKERYVKVFLVTDGHHTVSKATPETIIEKIQCARGKVCDVYILGIGEDFPVQHSVDIRSRLHNGNSNLPYLFAAKTLNDLKEQMVTISKTSSQISDQVVKVSVKGATLPGTDMNDTFYLGEWVYCSCEPQQAEHLTFWHGSRTFSTTLERQPMLLSDLEDVFCQWNSLIIQRHRMGETVPPDILALKERIFTALSRKRLKDNDNGIHNRLDRKLFKTHMTNFRTSIKNMKAILETKTFKDEQELADKVLYTTLRAGKYEARVFHLKGHTNEEFVKDSEEFLKVFSAHKESIQKIETLPEDCCRITLTSTVADLQDLDFPDLIQLGKFEFLKQFTITGIPVFAPKRDTVAINPWSYTVQSMLTSPYTILSQVALESFAETSPPGECHKDVKAKWDEEKTRFNAIVPVFPPNAAKIMEPLVHTRLFAMCVTFAILKNPHIIDFNVHLASLAVVWTRILFEYPAQPRPEFVRLRVESIEATAALYINRPRYTKYWQVLRDNTAQALMTESTVKVDDKTLKCESLIKPMFVLHMNQLQGATQDVGVAANVVKMILLEFFGRCLTNYKANDKEAMPFTQLFTEKLDDRDDKDYVLQFIDNARKNAVSSSTDLLREFYTYEDIKKKVKQIVSKQMNEMKEKLTADITIKMKMEKVVTLRNVSSAGDVSWNTLKTFAREVGLTEDVIDDLFSERSVFIYVAHALRYRASRNRLAASIADYDNSLTMVTKRIQNERFRFLSKDLSICKKLTHIFETAWLDAYTSAHNVVVLPMTPQEIVSQARQKGIDVTEATFEQVYKRYRSDVGLLGNACQIPACPFYLVPCKRFNQHTSVERCQAGVFLHAFHRLAYEDRHENLDTALRHFTLGTYVKNQKPLSPSVISSFKGELEHLQLKYRMTSL
ncbi:uncharacterized protein LOC121869036 isoform X1 [Homarus americanus]|uniref:uncharacterized protein LOC121869036 isoform X1 n=1 Tax=Homarus americanus TaxID=6706 RepID=UPI001C449D61|nr:uncharacterized protein LOC121869036 isoform X1 [Homarus americanus]